MRSLIVIPAASLALVGAHPHAPLITGAEAVKVLIAQVHKQAPTRLRGGYHSETLCSGRNTGHETFSSKTELPRWHCTLELTGARFPSPCKAQAYVAAAGRPHRLRVERLTTSRYCHDF
jgi:hypothetical protein